MAKPELFTLFELVDGTPVDVTTRGGSVVPSTVGPSPVTQRPRADSVDVSSRHATVCSLVSGGIGFSYGRFEELHNRVKFQTLFAVEAVVDKVCDTFSPARNEA